MKVLIVCSGNFEGGLDKVSIHRAFVSDQVEALKKKGVDIEYFLIKGKGIKGYFNNILKLKSFLKDNSFDIAHAHSGLSGLVLSFARRKKNVVTYHGSDINLLKTRVLSMVPIFLSSANIFVSSVLKKKSIFFKRKSIVIPCGIDMDLFKLIEKNEAKSFLNLKSTKKIVLFSSSFKNTIKNYPLAKRAVDNLDFEVEFLEIRNRTREEVVLLLNAADVVLLTSHSEGSPQIIKEALSCNCPIVSLDVGDVKERIKNVDNCFISKPEELTKKLNQVLCSGQRSNGRKFIKQFSNSIIADKIIKIYIKVAKRK
ncbi:glycosyltransferase family 4 protein [Flavobacteriaceae bacterium]|nr:glycosyltransferase family 4 protein [Flavobacteriaceae bacterium]